IFSNGLSATAQIFGVPVSAAGSFVVLAVSSFALTSLDSVARVARSIIQEIAAANDFLQTLKLRRFFTSPFGATLVTVALGGAAAFTKWQTVWPVFGCANQLIAALTLMTLYVWMKKNNRPSVVFIIPMIFMFVVTTAGLAQLSLESIKSHHLLLAVLSLLLLTLGISFVVTIILRIRWVGVRRQK
ncbi:MAG: hypothetical protein ONB12_11000, partial [candidate division KSB1 bacterium]|nr:hypothetical protein [candidate division KSB1 bacterium]